MSNNNNQPNQPESIWKIIRENQEKIILTVAYCFGKKAASHISRIL